MQGVTGGPQHDDSSGTPVERWEQTLKDVRTACHWRLWRTYSVAVAVVLASLAVAAYRNGETGTAMGYVMILCLEAGWLCDVAIGVVAEAHDRFTHSEDHEG